MKITYDQDADELYIRFSNKKVNKTVEASDKTFIDLDAQGNIMGIEMLFVSKTLYPAAIKEIVLQSANNKGQVIKLPVATAHQMIRSTTKTSK